MPGPPGSLGPLGSLIPPGLPGPTRPLDPPGTHSNLWDPLELSDVMHEKDFSGITISFVYLRGYNSKLSLQ